MIPGAPKWSTEVIYWNDNWREYREEFTNVDAVNAKIAWCQRLRYPYRIRFNKKAE